MDALFFGKRKRTLYIVFSAAFRDEIFITVFHQPQYSALAPVISYVIRLQAQVVNKFKRPPLSVLAYLLYLLTADQSGLFFLGIMVEGQIWQTGCLVTTPL